MVWHPWAAAEPWHVTVPLEFARQIVRKWQGDGRRFPDDADWGFPETVLIQTLGEQMRTGCRIVGSRAQLQLEGKPE